MVDPAATYIDTTVDPRRRRHDLPGHDPPGPHRHRRGRARSARAAGWSTAVVGEQSMLEHTVARLTPRSAPTARSGPYAVLEAGSQIPSGTRTGPFYTASTAAGLDD